MRRTAAAANHKGQPTVILAKTVKGFGLGKGGEGQMVAHQQKKLDTEMLTAFRDRFHIPISDEDLQGLPFYKPAEDTEEMRYLRERRTALGGSLPVRKRDAPPLAMPALEAFEPLLEGTGDREISTTMAFVRILTVLLKDKNIGKNIVPIVPDEARTFGMEGLFRQIGIYSSVGQLYTPQDAETLMSYNEDKKGQMLEEGINEAGALCSWIAAGTAYANHGINMVPFYIYYSMFGFQRVGDFIWAAGDIQARGFLLGATAGRTTLAGEGLQHQDGHSQLLASTVPNCVAYDPDVRLRARRDHPRRPAPHVRGAGEHLLLHRRDERELRSAGDAEGRGAGHPQGHVSAADRRARQGARDAARLGHDPARMPSRRRSCSRRTTACRPTCSRSRASTSCAARRSSASAGTCCIRARRRACPTWSSASRIAKARSSPRPTTCASCRTRSASGCPGATSRSAPTASAAPIRAPRCASTSRSTATSSRSRRCARSRTKARSIARPCCKAMKKLGIDPAKPDPWKI